MSKAVSPHNSGVFPPPVAGCAGICRKSGATGEKKEAMTLSWLLLAGAERLELSTRGFGDRCSTN